MNGGSVLDGLPSTAVPAVASLSVLIMFMIGSQIQASVLVIEHTAVGIALSVWYLSVLPVAPQEGRVVLCGVHPFAMFAGSGRGIDRGYLQVEFDIPLGQFDPFQSLGRVLVIVQLQGDAQFHQSAGNGLGDIRIGRYISILLHPCLVALEGKGSSVAALAVQLDVVSGGGCDGDGFRNHCLLLHHGFAVYSMVFIFAGALPGAALHGGADDGGEGVAVVHGSHIDGEVFTEITGHHGAVVPCGQQALVAGQHLAFGILAVNGADFCGEGGRIAFGCVHPSHGALVENRFLFCPGQDEFQLYPGIVIGFCDVPGHHIDFEMVCHGVEGADDSVFRCGVVAPARCVVKGSGSCGHVLDDDGVHVGIIRPHDAVFQGGSAQHSAEEQQVLGSLHVLPQFLRQSQIGGIGFLHLRRQPEQVRRVGFSVLLEGC